jgi:hypothetical protein
LGPILYRGIRVGHLEDNERITRLLKIALEHKHQQSFVTERYGRGMYWQRIGFLSRANRAAKSTGVDFVESILAIFDEVTPAMNLSMQVSL